MQNTQMCKSTGNCKSIIQKYFDDTVLYLLSSEYFLH